MNIRYLHSRPVRRWCRSVNCSANVPGPVASLDAFRAAVGMNSFETREHLRQAAEEWLDAMPHAANVKPRFYFVEVSVCAIKDPEERTQVLAIATSFSLEGNSVDQLRSVAGRLLRDSPDLQRLQQDLQ